MEATPLKTYHSIRVVHGEHAETWQDDRDKSVGTKFAMVGVITAVLMILAGAISKTNVAISNRNLDSMNLLRVKGLQDLQGVDTLGEPIQDWTWYNDPVEWDPLHSDGLYVKVPAESDYWQNTYYPNGKGGYQADNAPFYRTAFEGNFVATVQFTGQYHNLYDQAGIMVRVSPENWMKCGVEFTSGVQHASTVITRDGYSDWSILTIQPLNPPSIYFQVKRIGSAIETFYSLDGEEYTKIRMGYLTDAASVQVGLVAAAPSDSDGFKVVFSNLTIGSLSDEDAAHEE